MSCSYCGAWEHNRVGCSSRKERVNQLRAEGIERHHLLREEEVRRKSKEYKKMYGTPRVCSWCRFPDHNRRTCPDLKEKKSKFLRYQVPFRKEVFDAFKKEGIGIGTLVKFAHNEYDYDIGKYVTTTKTMMVTNILWSHFRWDVARQGVCAANPVELSYLTEDEGYPIRVKHFGISETVLPDPTLAVDIVSPLTSSAVDVQRPSAGWFSGQIDLSTIFHKDLTRSSESYWSGDDHIWAKKFDFFSNVE